MDAEVPLLSEKRPSAVTTKDVFFAELKKLARIAIPMLVVTVCQQMVIFVSTMMLGHISELSLSGGAVATSFTNVTGFSLIARELTDKEKLVLRLEKQYPGDVGVIAAFFFNYVKLSPGEALYLGANEPHAYLFGECIECMATSDNVVRAGLTPKNRDVETLCSMLTYKQAFPEILKGEALDPYTKRYSPPFDEFEVDQCILPQVATTAFPAAPGASIFVITAGEGTMSTASSNEAVAEGDVLFAPANTGIAVSTTSGLSLFRAGVKTCV